MFFLEQRLELDIDYDTVGGPRFKTTVTTDRHGSDQRNIDWTQPLGRWQVGQREIDDVDLAYLRQFHDASQGALGGFRFRDWADYRVIDQPIGTGDGTTTQFQLFKSYSVAGWSVRRPITKPVAGTVDVWLDRGFAPPTINHSNGLVTFASPPPLGAIVRASCEFDVPVRFEQDLLQARFEAIDEADALYVLQNLTVVELRTSPGIALAPDPIPQHLDHTIDLDYDYGTVGGASYRTAISTSSSGHERRDADQPAPRRRFNIGDRNLDAADVDYWLALFRVCRGAAISFTYNDWQRGGIATPCRFEQDNLELKFEAFDPADGDAIFYLSGAPIVETVAGVAPSQVA